MNVNALSETTEVESSQWYWPRALQLFHKAPNFLLEMNSIYSWTLKT